MIIMIECSFNGHMGQNVETVNALSNMAEQVINQDAAVSAPQNEGKKPIRFREVAEVSWIPTPKSYPKLIESVWWGYKYENWKAVKAYLLKCTFPAGEDPDHNQFEDELLDRALTTMAIALANGNLIHVCGYALLPTGMLNKRRHNNVYVLLEPDRDKPWKAVGAIPYSQI